MAFYNTTLSQSLDDRYYKYSEIREIYRNQTNQIQTIGANSFGALGDNTAVDRSFSSIGTIPGNWIRVSSGQWAGPNGGINYAGSLWTWGANDYGALGHNNTTHRSSPVQVGSSKWTAISCNRYNTAAIRSDGGLFIWGDNTGGQLGQADRTHRSSPVQVGTSSWTSVSIGESHAVAIRSDGTLWSWGGNTNGQLGVGDNASRSSPVQIGSGNSWIFIAAGIRHSYAIRSDYTLWSWGWGSNYQLGDNTNISRSSPVQVTASDSTVSFVQVSSDDHTLALSTSGRVYAWGQNQYGQCGLGVANSYVTLPSPINILGAYTQVQSGGVGSTILRSDGAAFWFGIAPYMDDGQASSPVQIGALKYRSLSQSALVLLLLKE